MIKLLIVDDEESVVFALKRYFQTEGFEVDTARELEEAEAFLACARYDMVVADLTLGEGGSEGFTYSSSTPPSSTPCWPSWPAATSSSSRWRRVRWARTASVI